MPLGRRPGDTQADFGRAMVSVDGQMVKAAVIVMSRPSCDAVFCRAFPCEFAEAFHEGHAKTFEFFGSVPRRISYDNTRIAVGKLTGRRGDLLTELFLKRKSY